MYATGLIVGLLLRTSAGQFLEPPTDATFPFPRVPFCAMLPDSDSSVAPWTQAHARCAMPMEAGDVALFRGQLMTPELAADVGIHAADCDEACALKIASATTAAGLDLAYQARTSSITIGLLKHRIGSLKMAIEAGSSASIMERALDVSAGVGVGAGLSAVFVLLLHLVH